MPVHLQPMVAATLLATSLFWLCHAPLSATAAGDVPEGLRAIATGYRANRYLFVKGKCRFQHSIHKSASESESVAGVWISDGEDAVAESVMYWRDDRLAIKMRLDPDQIRAQVNQPSYLAPVNLVVNGRYALDHEGVTNTAVVHSPENYHLNIRRHPFNLAADSQFDNLAYSIEFAEARNFEGIRFSGPEKVERDGRTYWLVKKEAESDSHDIHWYVDPERGFLSIITEYYRKGDGELHSRMVVSDSVAREGGFFPMRAVLMIPRRSAGGRAFVDVREMKVLELDTTYDPTDDDLTLLLPNVAQYSNGIDSKTAKTLFREAKSEFVPVAARDLAGIDRQLRAVADERRNGVAARAQKGAAGAAGFDEESERPRSRNLLWIIGANVVAFVVIGAIFFWRQRHRV